MTAEETQQKKTADKGRISIIVAIGKGDRALGNNNELLWHIPEDLKRFKELTLGHPIIMGRKTWESLPEKFRPLPERTNIVITRNESLVADGATVAASLEEALTAGRGAQGGEEIFIIGGGEIYRSALPIVDRLYLTIVDNEKEADVFFPDYSDFKKITYKEEREFNNLKYTWLCLER